MKKSALFRSLAASLMVILKTFQLQSGQSFPVPQEVITKQQEAVVVDEVQQKKTGNEEGPRCDFISFCLWLKARTKKGCWNYHLEVNPKREQHPEKLLEQAQTEVEEFDKDRFMLVVPTIMMIQRSDAQELSNGYWQLKNHIHYHRYH